MCYKHIKILAVRWMKFDLYNTRMKYGYSLQVMASFAGINWRYYQEYERRGEIPSKYIYTFWCRIPEFPIPYDFFYYTSVTLLANMKYHGYSQNDIRELLHFNTQAAISRYLKGKYPMYERKEDFRNAFKPLIIPFILTEKNGVDSFSQITDLVPKGILDKEYQETRMRNKKKEKDDQSPM